MPAPPSSVARTMPPPEPDPLPHGLARLSAGHPSAAAELLPLVYDELRRLAHDHLRRRSPAHTLQATALVHEAYLKLVGAAPDGWQGRAHFLAVAATAMRQVLANHARDASAQKRGGGAKPVRMTLFDPVADDPRHSDFDPVLLHETLERLAALDPAQYRVVELRFFAGMSVEEVASVLQISTATVKREWRAARAWLSAELADEPDAPGGPRP